MLDRKLLKNLDYTILIIVSLLFAVGVVAIASATKAQAGNFIFVKQQLLWFITGIVVMLTFIVIDYNSLGSISSYLFVLGILSLVAVLIPGIGVVRGGARCWFPMPGGSLLQPAEFVKIIFILNFGKHIARIKAGDENAINQKKNLLFFFIYVAIPIALLIQQPDYGMSLVFIAIAATMLFVGGICWKYIAYAFGVICAVAPVFFFLVLPRMEQHVRNRIMAFINPAADPLGAGYHAAKSQLAIGSGKIWGQGMFKGIQTQLEKGGLPAKETDFIFAVIGEEFGFVCSIVIIILFVLLIVRCINIAQNARDLYGSLLAIGITAMFGYHFVQNVGMTVGVMPITGLPLPFMSYGGSSLWTNMAAVGLVLNVGMRRQKINF